MRHTLIAILMLISWPSFGQTANYVKLGYPDGGTVEITADNDYCVKTISVHLVGVEIKSAKIARHLCNAWLQEASLHGESSINLLSEKGGFGWELDIPYGKSDEDFSIKGGRYNFVLGKDVIEKTTKVPVKREPIK
jgi:hypothetical protein